MTVDEAQAVHAAYQPPRKDRPPASEYMRYMQAKKVLAGAKLLTLTAGQRGFLEAARMPGDTPAPVAPDLPVAAPAPQPMQASPLVAGAEEPPPWATDDTGFPAPNEVSVEA